jgi:glycosyltransferase involved in cell wall biosynthesis
MPEVSVVIPTYNTAHYLGEAIDSVLIQSFRDIDILVIDDGSTDETEALMCRYGPPVRYIRQPNGGVAAARNRGIAEARGRYVAFLDADDVWQPQKLERQLAALAKQHSNARICYTAFIAVTTDLIPLGKHPSQRSGTVLEDLLTLGNVVGTPSTVLVERTLMTEEGGFDPALSQCADWDLWVRLAAVTDFAYVDEPLVGYRQHGNNMSRNAPLLEQDSVRVLEKGFAMPQLPASLRARRALAFARNYMVLAGSYFHAGRYRDFLRCATRAIELDARQLGYLFAFPVRRLLRRLRARRASYGA